MTDRKVELAALKAELGRHIPAQVQAASVGSESGKPSELEAMSGELRDILAEASEETREAIVGHPLVAVGAAFLLGIIVSRVAGR